MARWSRFERSQEVATAIPVSSPGQGIPDLLEARLLGKQPSPSWQGGWAPRLCACASHPSPGAQGPRPSAQLFSGMLPTWVPRLKLPDAISRALLSHSDSVSPLGIS